MSTHDTSQFLFVLNGSIVWLPHSRVSQFASSPDEVCLSSSEVGLLLKSWLCLIVAILVVWVRGSARVVSIRVGKENSMMY